jgi:acyl-CoA synthetase (AMP-forming)/AMP-acid ligase II
MVQSGVTHVGGTPTVLQSLIDVAPDQPGVYDGIKRVVYGGSAVTSVFVDRLARSFPNAELTTSYGATEFAGAVTRVTGTDARAGRLQGAGRPISGASIEIRGPDGQPLPTGEVGEIAVRSPWQTLGYWHQPAETADTYGDDGFIQVGDLGRFDDDGWLHVVGRLKEMIITGGENVFPSEVERELSAVPGVAEAVVFGVPDPHWGERVEAVVRPSAEGALDPDVVRTSLRDVLAGYKIPKRVHLVNEIPLTGANKVDRAALTRAYSNDRRPTDPPIDLEDAPAPGLRSDEQ